MLAPGMPLSREEQLRLVETARTGTPAERAAAHRELLDFFRPYAMAVVQRTLAAAGVGREHAEEAWLQATFRMFTVGLDRFAGDAAPLSYFLRIALHAAVDVVRTVLRPSLPGPDAPLFDAMGYAPPQDERAVHLLVDRRYPCAVEPDEGVEVRRRIELVGQDAVGLRGRELRVLYESGRSEILQVLHDRVEHVRIRRRHGQSRK